MSGQENSPIPEYIAHIRKSDGRRESVHDHLMAVRLYAEKLGGKIGMKHLAGLSGLLHDMGKYTTEFRTYLEEAVANPDSPPRRGSVDHSTAGGKWLYEQFHRESSEPLDQFVAEWIANCIVSHHGGLKDYLSPDGKSPFLERMSTPLEKLPEYERTVEEFLAHTISEQELHSYFAKAREELNDLMLRLSKLKLKSSEKRVTHSLAIKYLFSCLIDADRTKTRQFDENESEREPFDHQAFFRETYEKLSAKLNELGKSEQSQSPLNRLRREMSNQCDAFAVERPSGVYTLSIPTGGGKTLASFRYALRHALETGKERIIYIVPFTTIIEQNVEVVRELVSDPDLVLEHHSNVADERDLQKALRSLQFDKIDDKECDESFVLQKEKLSLAQDTWDRPVIFTTMVQFLNTFYAKGSRHVRRLHQLANSVIIFDEVQAVPSRCISLFNASVNFLHEICGSTLVLCTATQPALQYVKRNIHLSPDPEMIRGLSDVMKEFKRVELRDETGRGALNTEQLADFVRGRMGEINQLLVVLNTKAAVRKLFQQLKNESWTQSEGVRLYHLSTIMCPEHRKAKLEEIREQLENPANRIICISTQLIEAGVDISFQGVIRSLAGLDSIAQAAGRCNRHGKDELRYVDIIRAADEHLSNLPEIKMAAEQTERLLSEFKKDPQRFENDRLSLPAIQMYFHYYYKRIESIQGQMDYRVGQEISLFELLNKNEIGTEQFKNKNQIGPPLHTRNAIASVEHYFEVISNAGKSVIVPYDSEAVKIILDLNGSLQPSEIGDLLRSAQKYTVTLYDQELRQLDRGSHLEFLQQGRVMALSPTAFSEEYGIDPEGNGQWDALIS